MKKLKDFIFGTKIGYLLFMAVFGILIWVLLKIIIASLLIEYTLHLAPFILGVMLLGLFNSVTLYRKMPWFNPNKNKK